MPRLHLLSTPEGLKALHTRQSAASIQEPHGFVSTDVAFRDTRAAPDLHGLPWDLFQASAKVHQTAKVAKGRLTAQVLADLGSAPSHAQDWR